MPYKRQTVEDQRDLCLQERKLQLGITDVQLRLTPLEEVFTAVARQAEVQHAQQTKETTELVLAEGNVLQVCCY